MYLLEFVYNGGSHPGTKRRVISTDLPGDKIAGIDVEIGEYRQFITTKIDSLTYWELPPVPDELKQFETILNAAHDYDNELSDIVIDNIAVILEDMGIASVTYQDPYCKTFFYFKSCGISWFTNYNDAVDEVLAQARDWLLSTESQYAHS